MAHIHERINFAVAVFVVQKDRVLLCLHRELQQWLPLGGHVELDEDPEEAALREVREESGLEVELWGERPPFRSPGTRALIAPRFLDIHTINPTHQHIGLIYWARPQGGQLRGSRQEHHAVRWCTASELEELQPGLSPAVEWYARRALAELGSASGAIG
ncbi:MAG: NUDIX domain-containing protein [Verrucomicrobiota bacterium]|nr:NUDIX domain-containing protein [Verrucomicrobiota bacterium]